MLRSPRDLALVAIAGLAIGWAYFAAFIAAREIAAELGWLFLLDIAVLLVLLPGLLFGYFQRRILIRAARSPRIQAAAVAGVPIAFALSLVSSAFLESLAPPVVEAPRAVAPASALAGSYTSLNRRRLIVRTDGTFTLDLGSDGEAGDRSIAGIWNTRPYEATLDATWDGRWWPSGPGARPAMIEFRPFAGATGNRVPLRTLPVMHCDGAPCFPRGGEADTEFTRR